LVDLGANQVLYERDASKTFLPASMTKAMTALVAFNLIRQGRLREDQTFRVSPETAARWSGKGTSLNLAGGSEVAVRDLIAGITIVSANDAAVVLAEGASGSVANWTALMNAEAGRLGMKDSHFGTPNGWPDGGKTKVSARDLVRLADALINGHPELYRHYFGRTAFIWRGATLANRDPTVGVVPGADGIKTGHTAEAGYNFLGSAKRGERRLVSVVASAPSEAARAAASRALLEWGFSAWDSRPLVRAGQTIGSAKVQLGDARSVELIAPRSFSLALPKGVRPRVVTRIRYDGPLRAPIAQGALVAGLEVAIDGQPPHVLPLVAGSAVGSAGPFDRLINGLAGLLG
jgi:D-alanyl-D-alanine carboxypeptidase (penicillin-binding protein 5/6)